MEYQDGNKLLKECTRWDVHVPCEKTVNTELESKLKELNRRGCTYSWHMFSNAASDRDRYTNTPLVNQLGAGRDRYAGRSGSSLSMDKATKLIKGHW